MRCISLLIAFCFTTNLLASTGSLSAFEAALDEYQYSMTVEWDQADTHFQKNKSLLFLNKIEKLMKSEGLTKEEIISVIEKKINNKAVMDALKLKMNLAGEFSSSEEIIQLAQETSSDFYSQGASWHGTVIISAVLLSSVLVLGFAIWYSATHGCQEYAQVCDEFGCRNNYDICLEFGYVGPHL